MLPQQLFAICKLSHFATGWCCCSTATADPRRPGAVALLRMAIWSHPMDWKGISIFHSRFLADFAIEIP